MADQNRSDALLNRNLLAQPRRMDGIVAAPSAVEQRSRAFAQFARRVGKNLVRDGRAEHQRERGRHA